MSCLGEETLVDVNDITTVVTDTDMFFTATPDSNTELLTDHVSVLLTQI